MTDALLTDELVRGDPAALQETMVALLDKGFRRFQVFQPDVARDPAPARARTLPPFTLVAPLTAADGYGSSAEALWRAAQQHAQISYVAHDWQDDTFTDDLLKRRLVEWESAPKELVVPYFLPFAFSRFRGRVTVGMTMFETDDFPPFWTGLCNSVDGLIVPSEHCRRAFAKRVEVPIKVVPFGVDTAFFTPADTPLKGYGDFWFFMAGMLHYRKGAEFAVRAFREEFPREPDVRLLLKTRGHRGGPGFLDVGGESIDDPRIIVSDEAYTRAEMRQLYRDMDCLVAPSRGEASGLVPRECMACGTPVIVTDWGGLSEIADPAHTYATGIDGLEPAPLECSSYSHGVAGSEPIGNFCVPSVTELRAAMRRAYEDREANREMGERAAAAMHANWSWNHCAGLWLNALSEIYEGAS